VVKTFEHFNLHNLAKVQLKFVNDVFLNDKKVCGVLSRLETVPGSENFKLMIGIGVNLNTRECHYSDVKIATSVLIETGVYISLNEFSTVLAKNVSQLFDTLQNEGFSGSIY